jgi:hypothetical protein
MAGWIFLVSTARQQEQSSMSVMMREMFIYLKSQRAKAIKNKKPEKVPLHFYRLSSTEVTAGKKLSQDHDRMEKEMLEALRSWELASVGRSAEAYQLLISRCIACHEEECPGPLIYLQGLREF